MRHNPFHLLSNRLHLLCMLGLFFFSQCNPAETNENTRSSVRGLDLLRAYVAERQDVFDYELVHSSKGRGYSYYVLKMVSQKWLTGAEVDSTTWWHWVSFVIPDSLQHDTSLLMISGGSSGSKMPEKPDELILQAAQATGSPAIKVHNIPYQPLRYVGDSLKRRTEDGLIAYGWREFLERGATDDAAIWLARFPMTKAVVSAMDAVVAFSKKELDITLEKYVVAGASKRGWTTWTTAAVDDRVVGMAPLVIDMLNLTPSFRHHWQTYGFWAPAVDDYSREGIFNWMDSREFDRLTQIVEPYNFLEVYAEIPKLLINASGDQFFLPDSWKFYWDELPGEKHLAYIPNTGHSLDNTDAAKILLGFYDHIIGKKKRPDYQWEISEEVINLRVDPENPPVSIKLWTATNESGRDFRIDELGPAWTASNLPVSPDGNYTIPIEAPEKGWRGHFVELTYSGESPLKFTSGIKVLPETYPHPPFVPETPQGSPKD
ncbi:PhoPQ-activated pathogenicity-related protein [Cyclobacterium lianum]|uniref:PhoPQ-activated pathogenicity-related protein n=1 Tax=Cyclobacterium lianum TaxID=388280 RepID=A0A1M7PDI6_9BACT|nr:PhoPQ-activated pathogenicity-related family protein [Cyclobacterium lianum]SHN15003.1 PhoPQ-activated pathogenicity-related protein [Cyclobacterium lianum]